MPELVWDAVGERSYENGVDHGVLYVQNTNGTYQNGVVWNGLTSVSENPEGADANDLWADNIKYGSLRSAETFGATIEAYVYPDEFGICDGSIDIAPGVRIGQQKRRAFGFSYRTKIGNDTDDEAGYKLHIVYNATASPSSKDFETINDSPDAITFSWEVDTIPVPVPGHKPTSTIEIDSRKTDATKLAALEAILYGSASGAARLPSPSEIMALMSGTATNYAVQNNLINVTSDNTDTVVAASSSYSAHLTAASGHSIANVIVVMGGVDITSSAYSSGTVTISSVTGPIAIMAVANET